MMDSASTNGARRSPLHELSHASQLAIATGQPHFPEPLHVGRPNIGSVETLQAHLAGILERRWLTNAGPCVLEFEKRLCGYLGVKHCIPFCNATVALEVAARAAGLSGEVIVPSFTFIATAHALQWMGLNPVFCDINPVTHNLDPAHVRSLITPRTSAILGVHVWGHPADTATLAEIANEHGITLMYDAAHAFACSSGGVAIGHFGLCEVFSFHATKFLNTFEGGAIATADDEFARRVRLMQNFGFAGFDCVISPGTNGKMSEISAAMGLTSLDSIEQFVAANRQHHETYRAQLGNLPGVRLLTYNDAERNNYQYVVLEIDAAKAGLTRDEVVEILRAENILARRYFHPGCHRMEPYRSMDRYRGLALPVTERVCEQVLILPTGTALDRQDVELVCSITRVALSDADACQHLLASSTLPGRGSLRPPL